MPDEYSYTGCIDACGKEGQWNRAEWLLYEMRDAGVQVRLGRMWSLFSTILLLGVLVPIVRMCSAWMLTHNFARSLIMSSNRCLCKIATKFCLTMLISSRVLLCPAHFVSFIKTHACQQPAHPCHHPQPNTYAYTAAINACAKAKRWQEALALLRQMKVEGVEITTAALNAAMDA